MTQNVVRRWVFAFSIVLALVVVISGRSSQAQATGQQQPAAAAGGQVEDKPVEQTRKNIQVLKGLPDSHLLPMMQLFAASLGVRCDSCHVRTPDGRWEYDKDDKKMKQTARKMIQMTMDINKASFEGKTEVTCYACHHGSEHPAAFPALPMAGERPQPGANQTWPTPQQILDKYVQAVGGKDAADKINVCRRRWNRYADGDDLSIAG
jgi:hypothetical protein